MKINLITLAVLISLTALPGAIYAQENDPTVVVIARAAAMNDGDAEAAAAFFTDDAIYKINDPPPDAREMYTGREEILGRLLELVALNASMDVEIQQVDGNNVTTITKLSDTPLREMGVDFIEGIEKYTVQDGKITTYEWTLTEESGAKIAAALASPAALPESGGERLPIYFWIMAMGGVLLIGGIGLVMRRYYLTS